MKRAWSSSNAVSSVLMKHSLNSTMSTTGVLARPRFDWYFACAKSVDWSLRAAPTVFTRAGREASLASG
jgi:hypothetical protein